MIWEEGKGPDVVIELLSESTAAQDKGEKKDIYQDRIRVPEYFWFDPFSGEWAGFIIQHGRYAAIEEDSQGRLLSQTLGWPSSAGKVSIRRSRPVGYAGPRCQARCQHRKRSPSRYNAG